MPLFNFGMSFICGPERCTGGGWSWGLCEGQSETAAADKHSIWVDEQPTRTCAGCSRTSYLGGGMKYYSKLIIIVAIFSLSSSIAQGQENNLDKFIDDFVSKPFLIDDMSDRSSVSQSYLCELSKRDLRLIRNAIFASQGYIFEDPCLREFFSNKKWYKPTTKNLSEIKLSDDDEANVRYIAGLESDPSFVDFLKLFKKGKLPMTILARGENISDVNGHLKIPPQYLIKFFKIKCPGSLRYYPLHHVSLTSSIYAIIYRESLAAGGYCEDYYLATFTKNGELIDKLNIGRAAGDSGGNVETNTVIDEILTIRIRGSVIESDNQEVDKVYRSVYRDETSSIMPNGMFHEVSTNKSK